MEILDTILEATITTPIYPYQDAFWTPGSSPASAFIRNWYCPIVSGRRSEDSPYTQKKTYTTQPKLAHYSASTPSDSAPVLDRGRSGVAAKGVELQLGAVAHLGGEGLVARDVEVCAARNLIVDYALSRLHVAQDAYVRSGRHEEEEYV